ncbi:hypothetical protein EDD16DRAFT_1646832 [Pisolithus croceorrhizus]|nr:hypothetical protein EDD16DRAFT_1646832 [Pisolithus croceorrhizus]
MGAVLIVHLPLFTFTFLPPISSVFFVEPHLAYENLFTLNFIFVSHACTVLTVHCTSSMAVFTLRSPCSTDFPGFGIPYSFRLW